MLKRLLIEKTDLILKILIVLFLIQVILNSRVLYEAYILLRVNQYRLDFLLQYVALLFIVCYFLSPLFCLYCVFIKKKWVFRSIYTYVCLALLMALSVFPIPLSAIPRGLYRNLVRYGINLLVLLFVIYLHRKAKMQGQMGQRTDSVGNFGK
jgi:hypothetical protein